MNKNYKYLFLLLIPLLLFAVYKITARNNQHSAASINNENKIINIEKGRDENDNQPITEAPVSENPGNESLLQKTSSTTGLENAPISDTTSENPKILTSTSTEPANSSTAKSFSLCIKDSGAKLYGASWCSHCQNQKALFGEDVKNLPYIECARTDSGGQEAVCRENDISAYPTWVFADGSRISGELSFEQLSAKTGCQINN